MNANTKFGFIPVSSSISQTPIEEMVGELIPVLHALGGEQITEEMIDVPLPVFYLLVTGGTEEKVITLCRERKKTIKNEITILLANPRNNSLPSSLEILARLQQDGEKGKIVYLDDETNKNWHGELEQIIKHQTVFYQLKKTNIGLIGEPSDWLVASMPEESTIKNVWGPEVIKIALAELKSEISGIKDDEIEEDNRYVTSRASEIKEPTKKEIKSVFKVYAALKNLIKNNELNSVSVRCFDLVTDMKTTGCIALSRLNDEGVVAGCEGDLVSTLGMLWANYMTDQIIWMANPAQIDESNNSIWLAHCTVPIKMVENYKLRSHFESGLGVGIQGELSKGKITVLRLGGKDLKKIWVSNGEIIESGSSENLCRTQVKVKLHGAAKAVDLLTAPLGNHILLMRGSHTKELTEWWETFIA
ncbi:MAG: fucose isomerase [Ignavibacteriae bacterium HGW-Ignavibacteriae-3]|nr:MAG: fucose isomerase [Ignavibacteriae bacterium HGW-Ignavibacteriae-3]